MKFFYDFPYLASDVLMSLNAVFTYVLPIDVTYLLGMIILGMTGFALINGFNEFNFDHANTHLPSVFSVFLTIILYNIF